MKKEAKKIMIMNLKFSLDGVYGYDPHLFDELCLPAGADRELLVDTILDNYGGFAIARPIIKMRHAIGVWSRKNAYTLDGLWQSTQLKYEPIENYDRIEDINDVTRTEGSGTVHTEGNNTSGGTTTNKTDYKKAGFDSTTTKIDAQDETNNTGSSTGTNKSDTGTTNNNTVTFTHQNRTHGNIGVTTSQQMLESEREVRMFSWYEAAARLFADQLLIGIY